MRVQYDNMMEPVLTVHLVGHRGFSVGFWGASSSLKVLAAKIFIVLFRSVYPSKNEYGINSTPKSFV